MMLRELIESRVSPEPNTGCWLWEGSTTNGYGDIRHNGRHETVHRLMYELVHGPIPPGLHVLHRCDQRCCCNPEHLFAGTNQENIADSMKKGRRKGVTRKRPRGLCYRMTKRPGPKPKLSDEQRSAMVEEFKAGGVSKRALARKYGVSIAAAVRTYLREPRCP